VDALDVPEAHIVGWNDGAGGVSIWRTVGKVFLFAATTTPTRTR
jgi:hypothetical protein